jgi:hypothetical protein
MLRVALIAALLVLGLFTTPVGDAQPRATAQEATPQTACPATTNDENAAVASRWFEDALNGADLTVLDEILSPEFTYHSGTVSEMNADDLAESALGPILVGFPDVEYTIE